MSLLVWLPMTKDLSDQGLGGCIITNSGATLDNNGKLGKCYNFDGTNDRITVSGLNNPKNISVAFWLKRNATTNTRQFLFTAWGGVSIELGTSNNIFGKVSFSSGEGGTASGGYVTADSGWVHICYTFEDKVGGKMYINGSLITSADTTNSINWTTTAGSIGNYSNVYLNAKMNDFRIYDHVLSPKEIEILSRGLVCHYPLNGGGRGGDNLLANTSDLTKWTKEGGITTTWDSDKNMYKIVDSAHTSSRWGIYQDITVSANTTYTITCTLDGNSCGVGFGFYGSSIGFPNAVITTSGTKKRESYTLTSGADSTRCRIYLYTNCATSTTAWFSLPKLEVGSIATPWIPKSTDAAYTAMGYDSTTEYDVSGYGYNGTKNGTMTYSSDTAKYNVSTEFSKAGHIVNSSFGLTTNVFTVNFWVKLKTAASQHFVLGTFNNWTGNGFGLYREANGTTYQSLIRSTAESTYKQHTMALTDSVWQMLTYVYTGTHYMGYLNGVLKFDDTYGLNGNVSHPVLVIANSYFNGTPASENEEAFLSDFRFYATALSDTQIAELYNTAVSVSNNGALLGYELVEV